MCIYIYIYTCVCVYIYIYIYIHKNETTSVSGSSGKAWSRVARKTDPKPSNQTVAYAQFSVLRS